PAWLRSRRAPSVFALSLDLWVQASRQSARGSFQQVLGQGTRRTARTFYRRRQPIHHFSLALRLCYPDNEFILEFPPRAYRNILFLRQSETVSHTILSKAN